MSAHRPVRGNEGVYASYAEYLASDEWKSKRALALERFGRRCQACGCNGTGSQGRLQVHHLTYERVGRERLADLTLLCERCHKREHDLDERELKTAGPHRFSVEALRGAVAG